MSCLDIIILSIRATLSTGGARNGFDHGETGFVGAGYPFHWQKAMRPPVSGRGYRR